MARADLGVPALDLLGSTLGQQTALVQLRLQASAATDGDKRNDYVYYFSGEQGADSRRPQLILEYQLAD